MGLGEVGLGEVGLGEVGLGEVGLGEVGLGLPVTDQRRERRGVQVGGGDDRARDTHAEQRGQERVVAAEDREIRGRVAEQINDRGVDAAGGEFHAGDPVDRGDPAQRPGAQGLPGAVGHVVGQDRDGAAGREILEICDHAVLTRPQKRWDQGQDGDSMRRHGCGVADPVGADDQLRPAVTAHPGDHVEDPVAFLVVE
ncbi:hypothetical protein GCM10010434_028930 [Winogradskya humida]